MRPAFLQLNQTAENTFTVFWKQPIIQNRRLPLEPVFPKHCTESNALAPQRTEAALLEQWQLNCDLRTGTLEVGGLRKTLTDVFVRIQYLNGDDVQHILRPDVPAVNLAAGAGAGLALSYLTVGVEHLLFGIDHILFVIGLVLYIHGFWPLAKTITAFTLAHSITLALSVLNIAALPQGPVEVVIALSIVFLARELVLPVSQRSQLTMTRPWLMAFAFGLLHGFGFAGALSDIGLPREQLALSLLLFNVGIELGQLLIVALVLAVLWLGRKLLKAQSNDGLGPLQWPLAASVGCIAAYWTIDRSLLMLT